MANAGQLMCRAAAMIGETLQTPSDGTAGIKLVAMLDISTKEFHHSLPLLTMMTYPATEESA